MQKNLKVSLVAGLFGVLVIGGVVYQVSKTAPVPQQVVVATESSTEDLGYDIYDSERLEVEPVIIDEDGSEYKIVPNPEYDKQYIEFKLLQYANGDLSEEEYSKLKEEYGTLVDEIQSKLDTEEVTEPEPVTSDLVIQDYISDGFISYSCDEKLNDDLQSYIDKVPSGVIDAISSIGYHIELREDVGTEVGHEGINWCGVTIISQNRIIIEANTNKFRKAVVHEIGHAYDDYLGGVSTGSEFYSIYEAEKNSLILTGYSNDGQYKENAKEYFAEAIQMYVCDSATLQSSAPQTYMFVKNCIE